MKKHRVIFMPHAPILLKEIGAGKELEASGTLLAMDRIGMLLKNEAPDTIIYITPHGNSFSNGTCILWEEELTGDFGQFGHPDISFRKKTDMQLTEKINEKLEEEGIITVIMDKKLSKSYGVPVHLDHGAMVPMYFVDKYIKDYEIVHITTGHTSLSEHYYIGKLINDTIKKTDKKILLICSGDLSHALSDKGPYSYNPKGPAFDKLVKLSIEKKDPISLIFIQEEFLEGAAQCGLRSFLIGFGSMDGMEYDSKVYSYEGPFGVGYLTGMLESSGSEAFSLLQSIKERRKADYNKRTSHEDDYIKLARKSIEHYIQTGKRLSEDEIKKTLSISFVNHVGSLQAGCFVSIHKKNKLRGCIGTIAATSKSLIDEIVYNSISAATKDHRFDPIREDELYDLEIKVDILFDRESIKSKNDLDIIRYGVIVEKDGKRGLLLPNIEGINSVDEQVRIAMQKAGIESEENIKLFRFEVERHEILTGIEEEEDY